MRCLINKNRGLFLYGIGFILFLSLFLMFFASHSVTGSVVLFPLNIISVPVNITGNVVAFILPEEFIGMPISLNISGSILALPFTLFSTSVSMTGNVVSAELPDNIKYTPAFFFSPIDITQGIITFPPSLIEKFFSFFSGKSESASLSPSDAEIIFIPPTPVEGSMFDSDSIYVNMSNILVDDNYAFVDMGEDILGWWRFEEADANGDVIDDSGNANNGDLRAGAYLSSGKYGNAGYFEGDNSHMQLGDSALFDKTQNFTVSLWVNPNQAQTGYQSGIFTRGNRFDTNEQNQYVIYFEKSNFNIRFLMGNKTDSDILGTNTAVIPNQWNHVACGVDSSSYMFCFVNGEFAGSKQRTLKNSFAPEGVYVGLMSNGKLNGSVDEILFFDREISLEEAKALYDAKNNNVEANFTNLGRGIYDILGYAVDIYSNIYSNQRTIVLGAPEDELQVEFNNPVEGQVLSANELPLALVVTLSKQGKSVEYSLDGGVRKTMIAIDDLHYTASVGGLTNGNHNIQIYAEDIYGKINNTEQVSFGVATGVYPIINFLESTSARMAPHTVYADAINSINMGPWEKSTFIWDFDANNQEVQHLTTTDPRTGRTVDVAKEQKGFNVAYTYREPGTYTIKLIGTDKDRNIGTNTKTITILPDARTKRYIDAVDGSDLNDGATPESAWKTLGYAWIQLTSDMSLLFKRGQVHEVSSGNSAGPKNNVYIGAYGTGDKPILKWTGTNEDGVAIFTANTASENVFIENIYFDTIYSILESRIDALEVNGKSTTLANSEFYNFSTVGDMGGSPEGVFIFNDKGWRTRKFDFFSTGAESIVIIGADFKASLNESVIRLLPDSDGNSNSLVNIEWTHFDQEGKIKSAFRYQAVQYGHMYQSMMSGGADKISQDDGDSDYIILDGVLRNTKSELNIGRNANNVMIRNSVFDYHGNLAVITAGSGAGTDCKTTGLLPMENISIVNNLFRVEETGGKLPTFVSLNYAEGGIEGVPKNSTHCFYLTQIGRIIFSNNLFITPQRYGNSEKPFFSINCGKWDMGGPTSALPCEYFDLTQEDYFEDITDFSGNVFPSLLDSKKYISLGGVDYDWNWLSIIPSVSNLARESIADSDVFFPDYRPDSSKYPVTTTNAKSVEGVVYDYYGNLRQGDVWYAGAVDAPGVEMTCSEQGGDICGVDKYCPGSSLIASDTTRCCSVACEDVVFGDLCNECGNLLFNICDEVECHSISEGCYYEGLLTCTSCGEMSCSNYNGELNCINDRCSLGNCRWGGSSCATFGELSCIDLDSDGYNVTSGCGVLDCDDSASQVYPNSEETDCSDKLDNDCDGYIDEDDPNCWAVECPTYEEGELPYCINAVCNEGGFKLIKNDTMCDDGNACTEDSCTGRGCKNKIEEIYLSPSPSGNGKKKKDVQLSPECTALIENCADLDEDGRLDYNSVNCTIGKDICIKRKMELNLDELEQYKPKSKLYNITYSDGNDVRNLTEFEVYKSSIARVSFDRLDLLVLNESGCFAPLQLDSLISIEDKRVNISTEFTPELDSAATLTFYNVAYDLPMVKMDGVVCGAPNCVIQSYSVDSGTLVVNVSGFSMYEVVESFETAPEEEEDGERHRARGGSIWGKIFGGEDNESDVAFVPSGSERIETLGDKIGGIVDDFEEIVSDNKFVFYIIEFVLFLAIVIVLIVLIRIIRRKPKKEYYGAYVHPEHRRY